MFIISATGVEINGTKFYGVPMFMGDCISDRQSRNIAKIPTDTDVLITHSPAYGILDYDDGINYGNKELLAKIHEVHPRLHLFGHIHAQHGIVTEQETTFSNGAIMDSGYTRFKKPTVLLL